MIPAFAGTIGKIALVSAFAMAWAAGLGITDPSFVSENVRLELVTASVFTIIFSFLLTPTASPPGTLAPLIPLIPILVQEEVHPLVLAILVSIAGFIFAIKGSFQKIADLNSPGIKAGILLLFGILGINGSLKSLGQWDDPSGSPYLLFTLLLLSALLYAVLVRFRLKWLIIPATALLALVIPLFFGVFPDFKTGPGLPIFDPSHWWHDKWGLGFGLEIKNFISALPFALLIMTMWPIDALAVKTFQENNHPDAKKNEIMNMDASFIVVSLRNLAGTILGGAQTSAVWRSFMIPLAVVKRPIRISALLLAMMGIAAALLGVPIDISIFPPLVWTVLIFGVFAPMLEVGLSSIKDSKIAQTAIICVILGIAVSPVIGWSCALLAENLMPAEKRTSMRPVILSVIIFAVTILSHLLV